MDIHVAPAVVNTFLVCLTLAGLYVCVCCLIDNNPALIRRNPPTI